MKFSDLYMCSKCSTVYARPVNRCGMIVNVGIGPRSERCTGTIQPINYTPPTKDPKQIDIEDEIVITVKHVSHKLTDDVWECSCGLTCSWVEMNRHLTDVVRLATLNDS